MFHTEGTCSIFTVRLDGEVEEGASVQSCTTGKHFIPGISVGEMENNCGWVEFLQVTWPEGQHQPKQLQRARLSRVPGMRKARRFILSPHDGDTDFALVRVLHLYHGKLTMMVDENHRPRRLACGRRINPDLHPFNQGIFRLKEGEVLGLASLATGREELLCYTFIDGQLLRN